MMNASFSSRTEKKILTKRMSKNMFFKLFEKTNRKNKFNVTNFDNKWLVVRNYFIAISLAIFIIYIKMQVDPLLGKSTPFLLLFSAIILSGWLGGLGPGIVATLVTGAGVLLFFLPPFGQTSTNSAAFFQLAVFILEGALISLLLDMRRRLELVLKERLTHQSIITELGQYALLNSSLFALFKKTTQLLIETFHLTHCAIWQYIPEKNILLLQSGTGWDKKDIGKMKIMIDEPSQEGLLFSGKEATFTTNDFLQQNDIVSSMSVIIPGGSTPFGVLSIYKTKKQSLRQVNKYFLQNISHVLATAINKSFSEKALRESQMRFQKLFDSNVIGLTISNEDGILDANDTFLKLIGYRRSELKKLHWQNITPSEYEEADQLAITELKRKGSCSPFEKEYICKDGSRVPILIGAIMLDKNKQQWICFILDITKQKELEKRKDDFISIASHELKTPVTSLKVFTQLLNKKAEKDKNDLFVKHLGKMDKQVDKLTNLINDLLNITKLQEGKLEFHKVNFFMEEIIQDVVETLQHTTTDHTLTVINKSNHAVFADKERITQVLMNLMSNAIKYSPDGGEILISAQERDRNVHVSIKDPGIGIDSKYQTAIFERFFRINEGRGKNYPGLGIGLFFSLEIISRHKGKMWVQSQKGKGSTFSFTIPLPKKSL